MPDKFVEQDLLNLIQLGDSIINQVRTLLPDGAGNQEFDVKRTSGSASFTTSLVQKAYGTDWNRPLRNAGAAIKYGGGNCQEQASVAYTLLREQLGATLNAAFCVSWNYKHSFAAIGNPLSDAASKVVIVDSWPQNAQAVLWEDHFCYGQPVQVYACKPGGQSGKLAKARSKYQHIDPVLDLILTNFKPSSPTYNHLWCSKSQAQIDYHNDLLRF